MEIYEKAGRHSRQVKRDKMLVKETNQTGEYIHANTLQTITFRP